MKTLFILMEEADRTDSWTCTMKEFVEENSYEEFTEEVKNLSTGEEISFGGGAAPIITVRRLS